MNKKEIKKEYLKKIKLINSLNKSYYDFNKSLVADREYDILKKEILALETNYNFLESKQSPSKTVGYRPSKNFKKELHRVPMLSLANAFTEEDLLNFEKKILNFLSKNKDYKISYSADKNRWNFCLINLQNGNFERGF